MSEKHSQGPWKTRDVGGKAIDIVAADGRYVASLSSRPEREADARLIAAAPEMLALLRDVKRWQDRELRDACDSNVLDDLIASIDGNGV